MKFKASYIDISVPLNVHLPVWPGGYGFHKYQMMSMDKGDEANVTRLDFDVHSGTHIDAPLHFVENAKCTHDLDLDIFLGRTLVLEFLNISVISVEDLNNKNIPPGTERILFKTRNSINRWFYNSTFDPSYIAIDNEAANWLVDNDLKLVGIDGPAIQKFDHPKDTHVTLLQNEVIILEGLDLIDVEEGFYDLICLPLKAAGCEGISARAILKKYE